MYQIKHINTRWEPDNSHVYVLIEERVTTEALASQPPSVGFSQSTSRWIVMEFGWDEDTSLSSLNEGLFRSIFSNQMYRNLFNISTTICSVQLAHQCYMVVFIEEEEVGIPTIVEGRPYSLRGFPKRWKQEAKGGRSWLFS